MTNFATLTRLAAVLVLVWTMPGMSVGAEADTLATGVAPTTSRSQGANANTNGRLVCKSEKVLGSHIRKKVCKTQGQIDAEREASTRFLGNIHGTAGINSGQSESGG
jgi:hypothetical protein